MMKTQVFVLLSVWAAGWVFAVTPDRAARCPGAHDGPEAWAKYSMEQGLKYTADESTAIWNYLESTDDGSAETASIKNNLLDRLVDQSPIPSGLGARLLRLYRERAVNVRMRDYTLQHFTPYILNAARFGDWKNDGDSQAMLAELQGALWNSEGAMGGTALLALELLAPLGDSLTVSDVGAYAVNLAMDEKRPASVRATAIQTATRLGCKEVLGSARAAIRAEQPFPLRLAAVACLGVLGEASDIEQLKRLREDDSSGHVRLAARQAVDKRSRVDSPQSPKSVPAAVEPGRKGIKG